MNKALQLLESIGQQANVDIEELIKQSNINNKQAKAIRAKDTISLENQLDVCPDVYCFLVPAEDDEAESEKDEEQPDTQALVNY
jgi:hypothetical protein